jgi:hypothetical protein
LKWRLRKSASVPRHYWSRRAKETQSTLRQTLKCFELRDGTIVWEWHPQGGIPSRLGRRKTLTPELRVRKRKVILTDAPSSSSDGLSNMSNGP